MAGPLGVCAGWHFSGPGAWPKGQGRRNSATAEGTADPEPEPAGAAGPKTSGELIELAGTDSKVEGKTAVLGACARNAARHPEAWGFTRFAVVIDQGKAPLPRGGRVVV